MLGCVKCSSIKEIHIPLPYNLNINCGFSGNLTPNIMEGDLERLSVGSRSEIFVSAEWADDLLRHLKEEDELGRVFRAFLRTGDAANKRKRVSDDEADVTEDA